MGPAEVLDGGKEGPEDSGHVLVPHLGVGGSVVGLEVGYDAGGHHEGVAEGDGGVWGGGDPCQVLGGRCDGRHGPTRTPTHVSGAECWEGGGFRLGTGTVDSDIGCTQVPREGVQHSKQGNQGTTTCGRAGQTAYGEGPLRHGHHTGGAVHDRSGNGGGQRISAPRGGTRKCKQQGHLSPWHGSFPGALHINREAYGGGTLALPSPVSTLTSVACTERAAPSSARLFPQLLEHSQGGPTPGGRNGHNAHPGNGRPSAACVGAH